MADSKRSVLPFRFCAYKWGGTHYSWGWCARLDGWSGGYLNSFAQTLNKRLRGLFASILNIVFLAKFDLCHTTNGRCFYGKIGGVLVLSCYSVGYFFICSSLAVWEGRWSVFFLQLSLFYIRHMLFEFGLLLFFLQSFFEWLQNLVRLQRYVHLQRMFQFVGVHVWNHEQSFGGVFVILSEKKKTNGPK